MNDTIAFARAEYRGSTKDNILPKDIEFYYSKKEDALITFYIGISNTEYQNNPDYQNSTKQLIDFMNASGMKWQGWLDVYSDEDYNHLKECNTYTEYIFDSYLMTKVMTFRLDDNIGLLTYE